MYVEATAGQLNYEACIALLGTRAPVWHDLTPKKRHEWEVDAARLVAWNMKESTRKVAH